MADEPTISAVVTLRSEERDGQEVAPSQATLAKVKGHFTSSGFEVHAPFPKSFSIGGKPSLFERVFGARLILEEEVGGRSITTEAGSRDLPLDPLPGEVRDAVHTVEFLPPPDFGVKTGQ